MGVVAEFIREVQSFEEFSFSREELRQKTQAPESTFKKELARLVRDKHIVSLRKGFYLILPPQYQHYGKLPVNLYADKLFNFLEKPYYVGFYSAAAYHGASHQQIQQDYLVTTPPALRAISNGNLKLSFFTRQAWPAKNIVQKKSDAGFFNVSSPALTFADLIENQRQLGGLNRMMATLEELAESINTIDLENFLSWYKNKSVLQRMGFLLEEIAGDTGIQQPILRFLNSTTFFPVLLSPTKSSKAGSTGNPWKVDVNIKIESDL